MEDKTFYMLTFEDIQTVAMAEHGRELTLDELNSLIDPISERIAWYDTIADVLNEFIFKDDSDEMDEFEDQ